jgi:hypothetical protein
VLIGRLEGGTDIVQAVFLAEFSPAIERQISEHSQRRNLVVRAPHPREIRDIVMNLDSRTLKIVVFEQRYRGVAKHADGRNPVIEPLGISLRLCPEETQK